MNPLTAVALLVIAGERRWTGRALRKGWNRPLSDLMLPQALPQGVFCPILRSPQNAKTRLISRFSSYSGGGIRTRDLRVMSPTSYLAAPPRGSLSMLAMVGRLVVVGGRSRMAGCVVSAAEGGPRAGLFRVPGPYG
jgi:hypothetical protein